MGRTGYSSGVPHVSHAYELRSWATHTGLYIVARMLPNSVVGAAQQAVEAQQAAC